MNRGTPPAPNASFVSRARHAMALGFGLLLGQAVTLMAQREQLPATLGSAIATVFVAAASASFVLFVLGVGQQRRPPLPRAVLWQQGHVLAALIGVGLLLSLRAFDLLA